MELELAGRDELGRRVHLAFTPELPDIADLPFPAGLFVVLIGGPTRELPVDVIYATAERLLERGAVYFLCWGDGASRFEDIVDEAVVMRSIDDQGAPAIMTTSHEGVPLEEAVEFALSLAIPSEPYAQSCRDVVLVFHGDSAAGSLGTARNVLHSNAQSHHFDPRGADS